ncbi:MAG: translocation/assembly module TamB domain-containing protein [Candidatus Omnitrophica bacterium]|nr:translocation/assembly module TamB domain-containing protein [Candidatus Omnitrophota bacterium]
MSLRRKIVYGFLLLIPWVLCLGAYYLLFTPKGSQYLVSKVLEHYTLERQIQFQSVDGDLIHGITFNRLVLRDLKELPPDTELRVQNLHVRIDSFHRNAIFMEIINARLQMPVSEPLVINGKLDRGKISATLFSRVLDVREVLGYLPKNPHTQNLEGLVRGLDVTMSGDYTMPVVTGSLHIDRVDNKEFELKDSPVSFEIQYREKLVTPQLFGQVLFVGGEVLTKRTAIQLRASGLHFSGKPKNPRLDINGFTRISKVDITIGIRGQLEEPEIELSSEPSLPKEFLLLMVATGKKWSGLTESMESGTVSPALAKDFLQYLFFGGRGNFIADKFGLSEFSFSVGPDKQGVGAAKQLTDNLEVKYEIERESGGVAESASTTQSVGGEMSVTNRVTLDLKKEFSTGDGSSTDSSDSGAAEIMLKFKTSF